MKKYFLLFLFAVSGVKSFSQAGPGLLISEAFINPAGTDSPFEFVELVATRAIDFSITPYTVVVTNNGTATAQGWVAGGSITYGFEINTGAVVAGDVIYVGGSSMAVTGTIVKSINTGLVNGDGFGTASPSGVLGNGGANADAIGVFAEPVAVLSNSSVPVDAIFYGTGAGSAVVSGGTAGYQLPVNDNYAGGKLQTSSFVAGDPGALYLVAAGTFNPVSGFFSAARIWTSAAAFTDGTTNVLLSSATAPVTVTFSSASQQVLESAGTFTVNVNVTNANSTQAIVHVTPQIRSTVTAGTDVTPASFEFIVPAGSTSAQVVTLTVTDDADPENDEYIILEFSSLYNAVVGSTPYHYAYIKDNDKTAPSATNEVFLDLLTSYSNGVSGTNSAEIVTYDASVKQLYIANSVGAKLDIVDFTTPASPIAVTSVNISAYGNINSVVGRDSIIVAAIENGANPQDSGKVVFFDYLGNFISQVNVGAMPDMITFNDSGNKIVVACEGEPNNAYTVDPNGSVCVVDVTGGAGSVDQSDVTFINFTSFNGQENALRAQGIRIYGTGATASQDFEPEYVTISNTDDTAWVTLQENNAIAEIDLTTNTVIKLIPLGTKDLMLNPLDASNQSPGINLSNIPAKGLYLPDAVAQVNKNGKTYLLTANEGDARAWAGMNEEARISTLTLDNTAFPDAAVIKHNHFMGRLNATNKLGDTDNDGDIDEIYVYGARSFSIWNPFNSSLVYDNGDDFERITSTDGYFSQMFNASNTTISVKDRSDDKGPEPEGVTTGMIDGHWYAFIALERIGGCMMYNIDDVQNPYYAGYSNNRDVATNLPDRGAEGIVFIPGNESPNGNDLLILANEVSSTLSIFEVNTCFEKAGVVVSPSGNITLCGGDDSTLTATAVGSTAYQWYVNGNIIVGATNNTYLASVAGDYSVQIVSSIESCQGNSDVITVAVQSLPNVGANANSTTLCQFEPLILTGSGAVSYTWDNGILDGVSEVQNTSGTQTYTVTGTDAVGCINTDQITITVNPSPSPSLLFTGGVLSTGSFTMYQWYFNGNPVSGATSQNYTPTQNGMYQVEVSNLNGCSSLSGPFNVTGVSIDEVIQTPWQVYPNPFNESFSYSGGTTAGNIKITNVLGGNMIVFDVHAGQTLVVQTSGWPAGMYLITGADGRTERMIKK